MWGLLGLLVIGAGATAAMLYSGSKSTVASLGPVPDGMVWIPPGSFWMGCADPAMSDARPWHRVTLDGFWMDATPVTNEQFARFVEATNYVTTAERPMDASAFPGASREQLVPSGIVFSPPDRRVPLDEFHRWWKLIPGANWRQPEGPGSTIVGREKHPVVQVSWDDASAYARWAGKALPTEAQWEYAARSGRERQRYAWGDALRPGGKWMANIWQGDFPHAGNAEDGFAGTSPVDAFPRNAYGLHDMAGNVWQWCADWYRPDYYARSPETNPTGPDDSLDPSEPGVAKRVTRGGSFLCSDQYCSRYVLGARGKDAPDSGASHIGFRCVMARRARP